MQILVIGSGGREHALTWKLAQSKLVSKIYVAPGNGGTAGLAENVALPDYEPETIAAWADRQQIDLTAIGPDAYLAAGVVDHLQQRGLKVYGPTQAAARLEWSKVFAKEFMARHHIPSAAFATFDDPGAARDYIKQHGAPLVVKADGLAAGKGAIVAFSNDEALGAVDLIMTQKAFGEAGSKLVIEEYLEGEEVSLLAFCDGRIALPMLPVQDHKRIGTGDTGPNTGGMGTYTPTTAYTAAIGHRVVTEILDPTMQALQDEGSPFRGTLFLGLMLTATGPKVIEYNARFGDPETQVLLPLLQTDLARILMAAATGELKPDLVKWQPDTSAVCVVAASQGYPGPYQTGQVIHGLEQIEDSLVFHAGTKLLDQGHLVTAGGRVLNLVHLGPNIQEAISGAYREIQKLDFEGIYYRPDIGRRELERFQG